MQGRCYTTLVLLYNRKSGLCTKISQQAATTFLRREFRQDDANRNYYMLFRLPYSRLTLANFKGHNRAHFGCACLENSDTLTDRQTVSIGH